MGGFLGGVLLVTVHGEMSVTLSQYLQAHIADGVALFGVMMSVNGMTVLLLQAPLTRWTERFSLFRRLVAGVLLMAAGEVGFAFSAEWGWFVAAMIVFTLGEILIIPSSGRQVGFLQDDGGHPCRRRLAGTNGAEKI